MPPTWEKTWRASQVRADRAQQHAVWRAGLKLIFLHDYEARSLWALAAEVGLSASSIYNHIRTKQDLLFALIYEHTQTLIAATNVALTTSAPDPMARLCAFVVHYVLYHLKRK